MHDTDDIPSNPTSNPHLIDLIDARLSRRTVIGGAMAAGVGVFLGGGLASGSSFAAPAAAAKRQGLLGFTEVPVSDADSITVPPGYAWDVLIPWGTPLSSTARRSPRTPRTRRRTRSTRSASTTTACTTSRSRTAHKGNRRGLLVLNHEYTDASQIYTAAQGSAITPDAAGREKVAKALAGHGVTVVEIVRGDDGTWQHVVDSPYNRRITGTTPMAFSGPVGADHPMLASAVTPAPLGTLNNCAHGVTPWGTYLACEENWNGYFGTNDPTWTPTPLEARYGVTAAGFGYNWHNAEPRFDLAVNRNELNRFGWVVEIDPFDPDSAPVKRTALGRIKHEGATVTEVKGGSWSTGRRRERRLPLQVRRQRAVAQAAGARREPARRRHALRREVRRRRHRHVAAARTRHGRAHRRQRLGRSGRRADPHPAGRRRGRRHPLHRPEWVAVHPHTGDVYVTLTNGTGNSRAGQQRPRSQPVRPHRPLPREPRPHQDGLQLGHLPARRRSGLRPHRARRPDRCSARPTGSGSIPTAGCGSRPTSRTRRRTWRAAATTTSATTRCSPPTRRPASCAGSSPGRAAARSPASSRHPISARCSSTCSIRASRRRSGTTSSGRRRTANPSTVSSWPFGGRPRPATVVIRKLDGGKIGT